MHRLCEVNPKTKSNFGKMLTYCDFHLFTHLPLDGDNVNFSSFDINISIVFYYQAYKVHIIKLFSSQIPIWNQQA
jgi:hypothetical protein